VTAALPPEAQGKPIEVWSQDEARVGQQGTLTYVWAERGSRPPAPRDNRHRSVWLFGAVCPARGAAAGLVLPHVGAGAMSLHLAETGAQVASGARAAPVLDGAGWHQQGGRLEVPPSITLPPLPPYAPELNGAENLWEYLRANRLGHKVWDSHGATLDDCSTAWSDPAAAPELIRSVAHRDWASVNVRRRWYQSQQAAQIAPLDSLRRRHLADRAVPPLV
jgi:DDE superfamily endonuclease